MTRRYTNPCLLYLTLPYLTARLDNVNHVANRRRQQQTWQPRRVELDVDRVRFGFFGHKTDLKQASADHSHRVGNGAFVDHDLQLTFAGVVHVHFTRNLTIIVPVPEIVPVTEIVSITVSGKKARSSNLSENRLI